MSTPPSPPPLPPWAAQPTSTVPAPDSPLDRQFAAFIGRRWPTYRRKFAPFFEDDRFQPTWNWAAALATPFGPLWFIYRRLYVPAVLFWILPSLGLGLLWNGEKVTFQDIASGTAVGRDFQLVMFGILLSIMVLAGGTANYLLYRRARAAIRLAGERGDRDMTLALLHRLGRANWIGVLVVFALMLLASSGMFRGGATP